jgi:hypothetical protein
MMVVHLDHLAPYQRSGQAALRREQLGSNRRENRATGKEGKADHMSQARPFGKEEMAMSL